MWESIGSVNTGEMPHDEDWIVFALGLARSYVLQVCGPPPDGCEFDVMWHDHDLGSYPSLGIWSESSDPGAYFAKAEAALICFDDAVDWPTIKEHLARSLDETEEDGDEA